MGGMTGLIIARGAVSDMRGRPQRAEFFVADVQTRRTVRTIVTAGGG